jgi:hypothetical protein
MNGAVPWEFVIDLDCSNPSDAPCRIVLPHRSHLGTFDNVVVQPKGEWPLTFLCLLHAHLSVRSQDSIRHAGPEMVPHPPFRLWRVEYECGRENCGKQSVLYIGSQPDAEAIRDHLLTQRYSVPCGSHVVEWKLEKVVISPVAHEPPMR